MVNLSKEVLSFEKWCVMKKDLKFYYLKKKEQACAFYCKDETAFVICYDVNSGQLSYYSWPDKDDRSLIASIITYLPELPHEDVRNLVCSQHLIKVIENQLKNEKN
ncbi:MAG: hypothetical protein Q4F47_02400 [Bacteroidaceae bacterium]|nr:hypothetical protein [Bacteroidaceae bacterium]